MARLHGLLRSTALSQAKNEPGVAESAMCLGLLCELLAWSLGLEDGWLGLGAGNVSGRHRRIAGPFVTSVLFLSQQLKTSAPLHMVDESIQPNKPRTIMAHHGPR